MISLDSNAPYTTAFGSDSAADAVYLTATDAVLGECLAVIYRTTPAKLSVLLLGKHGTSGYVDMTLDASSRYFGACRSLLPSHYASPVRRALAMAVLRTYVTMDRPLLKYLVEQHSGRPFGDCEYMYDEVSAGELGSAFKLVFGRLPRDIGVRIVEAGVIAKKQILSSVVDVAYRDSDETIERDNELIYSLGSQLEQLFNPLTEYSPEHTEQLYNPPQHSTYTLEDDPAQAQKVCEELYMVQSHLRGDLIDFHQNFLVPLRIAVLRNEIPDLTMTRLNMLFPPTIDEVLRINNLFYVALQEALPFGSFEVLRACGTTLPYFYRALMRHEAATSEFATLKSVNIPEFTARMEKFGPARIEAVMLWSLNLAKIKLLLDRLASCQEWPADQQDLVHELYNVAVATVDSFGRAKTTQEKYDRRTLTPSGKLLSELTSGWPSELEYGWMQNRRVVAIFDGVDVLDTDKATRNLHHIVVLFTDTLVILQPERPIPMTSVSGLHIPYVGDMLMHSLLNQVPLDHNLPPLKLVAWAPIGDLHFASYNDDRYLEILGNAETTDGPGFACKFYELVQGDQSANRLVDILAKTKIATKMQDLHIFKFASTEVPDISLYATVHEIQHYDAEKTRFPVCIFMNQTISASELAKYGLLGAISVNIGGNAVVVDVFSALGYENSRTVSWDEFQAHVIGEVCYLITLTLSSQNKLALPSIVATNGLVCDQLLAYARSAPDLAVKTHRRHPNLSRDLRQVLSPVAEETPTLGVRTAPLEEPGALAPAASDLAASVSSLSTGASRVPAPLVTKGGGPLKLRKKNNFEKPIARDRSYRDLASRPSIASYGLPATRSTASGLASIDETAIVYPLGDGETSDGELSTRSADSGHSEHSEHSGHSHWESVYSGDPDAEQRDVDDWFNQLDEKDGQSLSTSISQDFGSPGHSRTSSKNTQSSEEPYQVAAFLDEAESEIYNAHAGDFYPPIHSRTASEVSAFSQVSDDASTVRTHGSSRQSSRQSSHDEPEYSWLAGLVHNGSSSSSSQQLASADSSKKLYAGLRESSIIELSSFLRTSDTSQSLDLMEMLDNQILGSNESTPRLT